MDPRDWGLEVKGGALHLDGHSLAGLALEHGTPLHVARASTIRQRCAQLKGAFATYPAEVAIHFSYKTNNIAAILHVIHQAGLGAEVIDGHELWLALRLKVPGRDIIFNGPNKSQGELKAALEADIGLLVVDSLAELRSVVELARGMGHRASVALRICPDVVPKGMNASSVTGSRRNQFGMDADSPEFAEALHVCVSSNHIRLRGVHAHIGSGIHDVAAFSKAADRVMAVYARARQAGAPVELVDLGGGLGTQRSREFTSFQMLRYLATGHLPPLPPPEPPDFVERYAKAVMDALTSASARHGVPVPALRLEPGRFIVSDAQVLLLGVGSVRERAGVGRFALTDGGAMSVSMMFLSELHAVFLANRPAEGRAVPVSVFGRVPSPMDVVYRNLMLPPLEPGDLLAVMDAGAYFVATSTHFGGPQPAVLLVDGPRVTIARRRETYEDLARLDEFP